MTQSEPRFSQGQNVRYLSTGAIGTINDIIPGKRANSYRVTISGQVRTIAERFLEAVVFEEDTILDRFNDGDFGDFESFRLFQTWFRLSRPLEGNLYSYLGSKTIFNPHQFKPLLRFLSSNSDGRIFIADEVGVGKTIESGIIIRELLAREILDSKTPILIVCPNSLGPKWKMEMKDRFNLDFHIHDGKSLKYTLESFIRDSTFPQTYCYSIVGIQLLRHEHYQDIINKIDSKHSLPIFGLVIVDEAHHMRNTETNNNKLGNTLSTLSEFFIMLSATPLNLRSDDLYNQMHILNPYLFTDKTTFENLQKPVMILNRIRRELAKNTQESQKKILLEYNILKHDPVGKILSERPKIMELVNKLKNNEEFSTEEIIRYDNTLVSTSPLYYSFTRTRKREALEHQVHREAWEVPITLSEAEMVFHEAFIAAIQREYLRKGGNPLALGFVTNMYRRMVASCIPAMKDYIRWALEENKIIDFKENPEFEDDSEFAITNLSSQLREEFTDLFVQINEIESTDNKYDQFKELLDRILVTSETSQVIVFSFFIRTIEYLRRRLENEGHNIGVIHGGIPLQGKKDYPGRYDIIEQFKRGKFNILLSSEVGGEGLDFQFCNAIINYDLPYNPMRIEQRIGRVDRFGQKSDKIIVANLFIKNTVDEEIYDRLYRRINLIEDGIGALEPILGNVLSNMQNQILSGKLTDAQLEEISQRIESAVASAKIQMEEFDNRRRELLGDDYLSTPINPLANRTFVTPSDAVQLTKQTLTEYEGCSFVETEKDRGELTASSKLINDIEFFLRKPGNESGYSELNLLLSKGTRHKVIFNGSEADSASDHIFLSPTGYWTKFLINILESKNKIKKVFGFSVNRRLMNVDQGSFLIFIFELKLEGIKTEIDLVSVPIKVETYERQKMDPNLLRQLYNVETNTIGQIPDTIDINRYFHIAREILDEIIIHRQNDTIEENNFKINSRTSAHKKASNIRINNYIQLIENYVSKSKLDNETPSKLYIRLVNGRIEKEKERLKDKISLLDNKRDVSIDYSLEGILYILADG